MGSTVPHPRGAGRTGGDVMTRTWLHDPRPGAPCTVIAEVAQAHDGSLGMAHSYIDAAAAVGADAIKFQTHIADEESTPAEPWRKRFSPQDTTRIDYWRRMEFTEQQWLGLREHAQEKGLLFLSSPFSLGAVELLKRVGVAGWKIASGEINDRPLLDAIVDSGLPILLSTGMSTLPEIDEAVASCRKGPNALAVMQCTSLYPCPAESVGLNLLATFRERYGCAVGLSDHSGLIYPGLAAATVGAEVIEVHMTLSREMFGPDVVVSLTTPELRNLVDGVRFIERMLASPVDKTRLADEVAPLRQVFMKSVVAATDLAEGTILRPEHLAAKKPGSGIPTTELPALFGRRLLRGLRRDEMLLPQDVERP